MLALEIQPELDLDQLFKFKNRRIMKKKVKIKMSEISKDTSKYSEKASELSHKLMIAGIAVIWVINNVGRNSINDNSNIHGQVWWALILFILALAFSIGQYFIVACLSEWFYHKKKKFLENHEIVDIENSEVIEPNYIENLTWFCFYAKHLFLISGYIVTLIFMISKF